MEICAPTQMDRRRKSAVNVTRGKVKEIFLRFNIGMSPSYKTYVVINFKIYTEYKNVIFFGLKFGTFCIHNGSSSSLLN